MKIKNTSKNRTSVPDFLNFASGQKIYLTILITLFCLIAIHPSPPNDHRMTNLNKELLSNPTEWIICGPASWEDLKNYLPEAKIAGVSVSVMLLPPFQSTLVCTDGQYSEPFGNDYIRWAQEIASLSLRYSNLTQYGIYELRENLDLGYLRQTYIDSVITASKSINPRLQFISPNKNFYVDKDATGDGSGSDWYNASTTVHGVFAANTVQAGDSIFVSGGSSGKVYRQDMLVGRQFASDVVIAGAWHSGHNGRVTFRQQLPQILYNYGSFVFNNCQHIKITNMNFDSGLPTTDATTSGKAMIRIYSGSYITVDNDSIISNGNGSGVLVEARSGQNRSHHITISNCYIEIQYNNINDAVHQYNIDPIWIGASDGGNTITGNTIIQHTAYGYAHPDFIQHYDVGSANNYEYVIANNIMIYDNDTSSHSQGIYFEASTSNRLLIYNNIIASNAKENAIIVITPPTSGSSFSLRVLNNTICNYSHLSVGTDPASMVNMRSGDTLIVKNNLFQVTGHNVNPSPYRIGLYLVNEIPYIDADYNHFHYNLSDGYSDSNLFTSHIVATQYSPYDFHTWDQWNALGYDTHSDTGYVSFTNEWGTDITDYSTTTGREMGNNLSTMADYAGIVARHPDILNDILGVERDANWDLGAIEFK